MWLRGQNINTPPLLAIFLISSLTLAYEVLLTRLLSIIQWHHFAYMIISIALLGYGASGSYLTVFQNSLIKSFNRNFIINICLFSLSSIVCFLLAQQLPFNPLELFWDDTQWLWLLCLYFLLILPFFFSANCIGLVFLCYKNKINGAYAADLCGAALGALVIIVFLYWLFPLDILRIIVTAGGVLVTFMVIRQKLNRKVLVLGFVTISFPWVLPNAWLQLNSSEYKPLNQTRQIIDVRVVNEKNGPLGLVSVVESPTIPFRYAPGLSLTNLVEPAKQLAMFSDGDGMSTITQFNGDVSTLSYLGNMTSALPYKIQKEPSVLILGASGGADVLQALYHSAKTIEAVELNKQVVALVKNEYSDFSGDIYNRDDVHIHVAEARSFLETTDQRYDLIQMALMDSYAASSAGLYALNESYLYTVEAMTLYLQRLTDNGVLALTRWIKLPPRDTLKLLATAKQSLWERGISNPERHIALIRSWNTATLLIKRNPLSVSDIQNIIKFCRVHSFDVAYHPNISEHDTNRHNILPQRYYFEGAKAILSSQAEQYFDHYKYDLRPATDDKPYFFNFLKWEFLPEIVNLPANQGLSLIEWGSIVLVLTLFQALFASLLFILLPLWFYYRRQNNKTTTGHLKLFIICYFTLLGAAFMFIEIAFIQKFILFLSHPTYAIAVVLTGFLFSAGIGSLTSKRWSMLRSIQISISGICICIVIYLAFLSNIFQWLISVNEIGKIILSLLIIFPLAFFMGIPFPLGLNLLGKKSPSTIPWAWGINGCASVVSAIAATLVALNFGFTIVIVMALVFYLLSGLLFLRNYSH